MISSYVCSQLESNVPSGRPVPHATFAFIARNIGAATPKCVWAWHFTPHIIRPTFNQDFVKFARKNVSSTQVGPNLYNMYILFNQTCIVKSIWNKIKVFQDRIVCKQINVFWRPDADD
jgi:hypothetical protein